MSLQEHEIKKLTGLTSAEVAAGLRQHGYNELPSSKKRSVFKIIFEILHEPMFILLVVCGMLYLFLGDVEEAIMLLGFVFVVMGITIYQENKTEKALDTLKDLSSPRALVIRDGIEQRIAGREVVVGDLVIVREGDRIPADAVLLWERNISVDESILTGESLAVRKKAGTDEPLEPRKPGGDDIPFMFSGTLVVQGQGLGRVVATGMQTELGKIGKALAGIEEGKTILQRETGRIVKTVFLIATILCLLVVLIYGFTRGNWLNGILAGITLAMAMLPEEFPVVLTIFLALGAWRMSKKQVLTRRIAAVETLGSATVLCVDKTGTLTQNRMRIQKLATLEQDLDIDGTQNLSLPDVFHELMEYGILASKKDPFDPMEKAFIELGEKTLFDTEHLHENWSMLHEYPLSRELLSLSHVYRAPAGDQYLIAAKGAPEAIMDLCHMEKKMVTRVMQDLTRMANAGLRVIGVAKAMSMDGNLPAHQHEFDFQFLGLVGLADPIRETVPQAIAECYGAGIKVVMITGDYPGTALNIARQIGLKEIGPIITGPELEKMTPGELKQIVRSVNIFARVVPEQKLLIVNAFKENGEIVAMTGDGVNDAPALKAAHIGVAMGERGTDVARETAGIVLLKDDFTSIVAAVRLGRRIFDNLKKAMAYIISIHVPIAGLSLIPIVLKWPIILHPVHIVFLELIIDPACTMVFEQEKEERHIMDRPPRNPNQPLFGKRLLTLSFLQGLFSLVTIIAVYQIVLSLGQSEAEARTLAFFTLIISNLCLIMSNRSWSSHIFSIIRVPNKALFWVISGAMFFMALVVYVPFLQRLFHFTWLHPLDIFIGLASGLLSVVWFECVKILTYRKNKEL